MKSQKPTISIIIPVYNEENSIKPFLERTEPVLEKISPNYEILFILDPCADNTEQLIQNEISRNERIKLVRLSRRFGQPIATMAGIHLAQGNLCVTIDVDLQDPPELIIEMQKKINEGYEVVYAKRKTRTGETGAKRLISYLGYRLINKLSDIDIPNDVGDYRIMTRKVVDELKKINESHTYLRGLVAYVGYKQTYVEYQRDPRHSGAGKYNRFIGSIKIGLDGLISFGSKPLQFVSLLGAAISLISFLVGIWYVIQKLLGFPLTPGLSTIVLAITFFSGVQLFCLGIVGEYIGRIYDEVKKRPLFIIDKIISKETQQ
jgi:glycosyltransferase involved in cell wall biosynthesis